MATAPFRRVKQTPATRLADLLRGAKRLVTSSPARFAVLVFSALILLFTGLYSLPIASASGTVTNLSDAFFTAVSTICVTGLSTVDMYSHWSPFGHALTFIGVNIGALGVLTLASILGMVISKRLGLRTKLMAAGDSNPLRLHAGPVNESQTVKLGEVGILLRTVAFSTLIIEAGLTLLLYPALVLAGESPLSALWEAPYYAAMAFTNTGFVPNAQGLEPYSQNYFILTVLMIGVFLGSIGFPVIFALSRYLWRPRRWSLHTKLTLITTILLFVLGGIAYLALEFNNPATLGRDNLFDTGFQAFFLSAMTRSGGFATIDIDQLYGSSFLVTIMLMFVGGGSASTAGGIKVTTLAVLAIAVWSEARGRQNVQAFGRRIPSDVQRVALSVVAWGATIIFLSTITIAQITHAPLDDVLFDVTSAFATVGLSTGLSETLTGPASFVMAMTMFMGRVGTVTLAAAVAASARSQLYSLPVERPIVG